MAHTNAKEQPFITEPNTVPAPQPWVTPVFERTPLNEALYGGSTQTDLENAS